MKILAIQFRYLGDAVLLTPALRALRQHFPEAELHVLVGEDVVPLLSHLPWLNRVWAFPRQRGRANLRQALPIFRALRREHFDWSVDFVGSDRGALVSLLCGARRRVAPLRRKGFFGRRYCYTQTVAVPQSEHESQTNFGVLSIMGIETPEHPRLEIRSDPACASAAGQLLPGQPILCHVATSQPKKEWPVAHWAKFYEQARAAGQEMAFCAGFAPREQSLLKDLGSQIHDAVILPPVSDLPTFLAVLQRARLFVSGDTGPLHFAAGLGVPTVSLFGPSSPLKWSPLGPCHRFLQSTSCTCSGAVAICNNPVPCMSAITPEQVLKTVQDLLQSS